MPKPIKPVSSADDAISKPSVYVGFDTETALSTDACAAPPLACLTVYMPGDEDSHIFDHKDAPYIFADIMRLCLAKRWTMVANHAPYDIVEMINTAPWLIPLVFEMLDQGLFECTLLCEKLDDIARGRYENKQKGRWHDLGDGRKFFTYALDASMLIRLGVTLNKDDDTWRKRFGELIPFPLSMWPADAIRYAKDDARAHWQLREKQENDERGDAARNGEYVYADAPAQTRMGVALALMRVKGVRTDPVHTKLLIDSLTARMDAVINELISIGFVRPGRIRPRAGDWVPPSKNTKVIKQRIVDVAAALGIPYKKTPTGDVCMDGEAIEMLDDPQLAKMREYTAVERLLQYTKVLQGGFVHAIHSEPNTLVANGRISWGSDSPDGASSPRSVNLTNLPTEPGVRECYVPREGNYFFAVDYSTLELCTVAQVCIWLLQASTLAQYLNQGIDLHSMLGSMLLKIPYDEFLRRRKLYKDGDSSFKIVELVRDLAKRANFGLWGGMGIDRFMSTCRDLAIELRAVGIVLSREFIVFLKETWQSMYPETYDLFKIANQVQEGSGQIVQYTSRRIRGGLGYADAANTFFSGLAADGAKDACYRITRAMYAEPDSPCFGAWLTAFIHDEFFGEARADVAHLVAPEVQRIAREVMQERIPDIKITCSVSLMLRWRKGAQEYRDAQGILRPYEHSPAFAKLLAQGKVIA